MAELNLCACMGARPDEPHCHCAMERLGLPRSEGYHREQAEFKAFIESGELDELFHNPPRRQHEHRP